MRVETGPVFTYLCRLNERRPQTCWQGRSTSLFRRDCGDGQSCAQRRMTASWPYLAYGSCLRGVATTDTLIDLYVLTDDLRGVSSNVLSRLGCRLIPPNVYYAERDIGGQRYRAKYAVLPMPLFAVGMTRSQSLFLGPLRTAIGAGLCRRRGGAPRRDFSRRQSRAPSLRMPGPFHPWAIRLDIWAAGFRATYATELRSEAATAQISWWQQHENY